MVEEILDLVTVESGNCHIYTGPIAVDEIIKSVITKQKALAQQQHITITIDGNGELWPLLLADSNRLQQVINHLVHNAIIYNKAEGSVTIALVEHSPNTVRLTINDSGVGIAEDKLDMLFQMFSRPGSESGTIAGSGIGLYVSKVLIERMDGAIGYRPRPEGGSQFWIDIPIFQSKKNTATLSLHLTAQIAPDLFKNEENTPQ